jgi:hypothetical protein
MKPLYGACLTAALVLAACGGGGNNSGPEALAFTPITGVGAGTNFSFDLGTVAGNKYYVTDRNNAAVDVFDATTGALVTQIKGTGTTAFAGAVKNATGAVDNSISGPNGVNAVGTLLFAGDVNSVKVIDQTSQKVLKNIVVGTSNTRADEGCVDSVHGIYMISTPEAVPPFSTFIDTATQAVVAHVTFTDAAGAPSAGLEQCRYDAGSDTFFVNNDGTTANPHGELVSMPGASIRAIPAGGTVNYTDLAGVRALNEGNCDPTGLALGPGTDIAVGCREGTTGSPLLVQIFNRSTGALVASVNGGGGDQLEFDSATNRYYNAGSRWTANGKAATDGTCSAASPCTPVLTIIDASSHAVVTQLKTGNNAHSVAIDPASFHAFVPVSSGVSPAGCGTCGTEPAGLLMFTTKP